MTFEDTLPIEPISERRSLKVIKDKDSSRIISIRTIVNNFLLNDELLYNKLEDFDNIEINFTL